MNRIRWYGPTLVLVAAVLLVMFTGPSLVRQIAWAQTDAKITLTKDSLSQNPALAELSNAFRRVGEVVEPSVVYIEVSSRNRGPRGMGRMAPPLSPEDDIRRWFFGPRGPRQDPMRPQQRDPLEEDGGEDMGQYDVPAPYANGSGWVYDNDGHIITNNHVIESAERITVRFQDGSERVAKVTGADPKTDIAVIQVEGGNLHPATLAKETVQQGDIVFAFGSPFRFEFSMSQGIVSAKGRELGILMEQQGYENFIQTDAAINPGNSGGPLTNIYGQVVGMNTAIASRTGSFNGLGFAIPADMVAEVAEQLIKSGKVTRGYLGIYINDLDPKMARTFGFEGKGVLVDKPIEGGPAEKAGVQRGDIITKIDGQSVINAAELRRIVARVAPGKTLSVQLFRNGKQMDVKIPVEEQPAQVAEGTNGGGEGPAAPGQPEAGSTQVLRKLGIEAAMTFTRELAERAEMKFVPGVIVRSVRPGSVAAAAGITPRSVISDVMNTPVKSMNELVAELNKHDLKKGVRVTVQVLDPRTGTYMPQYVLLELPQD